MRTRRLLVFLALLLTAAPLSAWAGDFMDSRVTFGLADNNLLLGPGQSNPNSPSPNFLPGSRNTLFFDNYNTRFSGFETLSHAVLYKKLPSYIDGLTTAAALVIRMRYQPDRRSVEFQILDSGSYIFLSYDLGGDKKRKIRRTLDLTAFPLSSDRFRLGYSFRLSWGGNSTFPRRTVTSPVPGAKLQFTYDFNPGTRFFVFAGAKTTLIQKIVNDGLLTEEETAYGFLGGIGFKAAGFQIEGGAAFFDKGTFQQAGVRGEPIQFFGFTGQASYSMGMPIGVSIDFRLYENDPDRPTKFFRPEKYTPGQFSFAVSAEYSYVVNMLQDPETLTGIVPAPGMAADLNFRMKYGYFRLHADFVFRDLGFILRDVPGFVPFQAFTIEQLQQSISPEFFMAIGVDYYIKAARLTLGIKGGFLIPAYFKGLLPIEQTGNNPISSLGGEQIVVILDDGDIRLLPPTDSNGNKVEVLPIISAKLNFKWQLSPFLAVIGEFLFSVDNNQTRLERSTEDGTTAERVFIDPIVIGFNLLMQARF